MQGRKREDHMIDTIKTSNGCGKQGEKRLTNQKRMRLLIEVN
jgi:hypothetical protein